MCGRYVVKTEPEEFENTLGEPVVDGQDAAPQARYNAAHSQKLPVVVRQQDGQLYFRHFQWGLIPHWADDPKIAYKMINARAESVFEKAAYKHAARRSRCLVPMHGFFEWQKQDAKTKQPFFIHPAGEQLWMAAGLYSRWQSPEGELRFTFTIMTTDANEALQPYHHRMPVLFPHRSAARHWIDPQAAEDQLRELLQPLPDDAVGAYPVSTEVNTPSSDHAGLLAPIGRQGGLFG